MHQSAPLYRDLQGIPVSCERLQTDLCLATPRHDDYAWNMQSRFAAFIAILVIGLQSSMGAFAAASPLTSMDCQSAAVAHSGASQDSCCSNGLRTMGCCQTACPTALGATASPASSVWYGRTAPALPFLTMTFASRGDSPLIRPPIL
jgi:hypothetical protein